MSLENILCHPKIDKMLAFASITFPGVYRVFLVFFVSLICTIEQSNEFSKLYLYIVFASSVIGMPFAAMAMQRDIAVDYKRAALVTILYGFFAAIIVGYIERSFSFEKLFVFFIATICAGSYELIRQDLLNDSKYRSIFFASLISVLLITIFSLFFMSNAIYICLFSFFFLFFPLFLAVMRKTPKGGEMLTNFSFAKKYTFFSMSSLMSTSINFLLPLIVLFIIGEKYSRDIAQVSAIVSVFLLVPRVLSNFYIVNLRKSIFDISGFNRFRLNVFTFTMFSVTVFSTFFYVFYDGMWFTYSMLGASTLLSQLSLPYSCVFSVGGNSEVILRVNVYSIFVPLLLYIFSFKMNVGTSDAYTFLYFVLAYQLFKLFLSHTYYLKLKY